MKWWLKILLLFLVIGTNVVLAYRPHFDNPLPLLGDEYVHSSFAKQLLDDGVLPFTNPYFAPQYPHTNFESGFQVFLAGYFLIAPGEPLTNYKYLVIIFMIINSALLFYLALIWSKDFFAALLATFFYGTISGTSGLLAHHYFIPLTTGITLLLLLNIFFHQLTIERLRRSIWYLVGTVLVTLVVYPPALFFFLGVTLTYLLFLDHNLQKRYKLSLSRFYALILATVLVVSVISIFILNSTNLAEAIIFYASWDVIQARLSPFFYLGTFAGILALIGLYNISVSQKYTSKIPLYWFVFSLSAIYSFYVFGVSFLVPFPRLFIFYLVGFCILAGVGGATFIRIVRGDGSILYRKFAATLLLLIVLIAQYKHATAESIQHSKILSPESYKLLQTLEEEIDDNSIIIADSLISLGVYPASGKYVVNLLDSNVGGGDPLATKTFISGTCLEKKIAIKRFEHLLYPHATSSPVYLLSNKKQDCDFLSHAHKEQLMLYLVDTDNMKLTLSEIEKTIQKPPQEFVKPVVPILTEAELYAYVVGNTIVGENWSEYFDQNGYIRAHGKTFYEGYWQISDSVICTFFPRDDIRLCLTASVSGNVITFYEMDGSQRSQSQIETGNPSNL